MRASGGQEKLLKRSAILRAAVAVIADRGYAGARMSDVAHEAEVADGTLYLYFEGKEDLLVSILEEYAEAFLVRARRDIEGVESARERLRRVLTRHLASLEADRPLAHVFQIELRHTRRFLRRVAKGKVADYLHFLQEIVSHGVARGEFRADVPVEVAARAVFGAVDECVTAWVLAARPEPLTPQAEPLLKVLLQGLAKSKDEGCEGEDEPAPARRAGGGKA